MAFGDVPSYHNSYSLCLYKMFLFHQPRFLSILWWCCSATKTTLKTNSLQSAFLSGAEWSIEDDLVLIHGKSVEVGFADQRISTAQFHIINSSKLNGYKPVADIAVNSRYRSVTISPDFQWTRHVEEKISKSGMLTHKVFRLRTLNIHLNTGFQTF